MSTVTETRLQTARTRRMLEDTAISAAGGGVLTALREDASLAGVWHAQVRCPDARRLDVRLDCALETVLVVAAPALSHAA